MFRAKVFVFLYYDASGRAAVPDIGRPAPAAVFVVGAVWFGPFEKILRVILDRAYAGGLFLLDYLLEDIEKTIRGNLFGTDDHYAQILFVMLVSVTNLVG